MEAEQKIRLLGESARFDLCTSCDTEASRRAAELDRWIYPAVLPDGRRINILKILQTNVCHNNCYYCAQRAGRDVRRTALTPDELAAVFDLMVRQGLAKGLFLSTGVAGSAAKSMDSILATVDLLRKRYQFRGYIHLKLIPGVSVDHVEQAVRLATRVSMNLEAPSHSCLERIAPDKSFETLLQPMRWVYQLAHGNDRPVLVGGQTTQFVVGAAGESDQDILSVASRLYRDIDLRRAYFSAFQPIEDTPLENLAPTKPIREQRLYQSDFLLREYGFSLQDITFDESGNLPFEADPKQIWADRHPESFPVDVNRASREELLRVPGIGPRSATRIVNQRRRGSLCDLRDLGKMGVVVGRAAPYLLLAGRRPARQLPLWEEKRSA